MKEGDILNIDGTYLIRWGIPGWILFIFIFWLILIVNDFNIFKYLNTSVEFLTLTIVMIALGIPIGYLLNQVHHVIIWVKKVDWDLYFHYELKLNQVFRDCKENGKQMESRYRYLLSRIHELGGILIAFYLINLIYVVTIISLLCKQKSNKAIIIIISLLVVLVLTYVVRISRNYFQRNLDALTMEFAGYDYDTIRKK